MPKKKTETEKIKSGEKDIEKLAKKLEKKIEGEEEIKISREDLERLKDGEKKTRKDEKKTKKEKLKETLVALNDYVKCGVHLGTKVITPHMRGFVYRRRADGLAVLNTNIIDVKLREAIEFLKEYESEDIFLACKRETGWDAARKFSEVTGIRIFTKKYPAGIITNPQLDDFFETELVIVCDPWIDKNAIEDAIKLKKPVIGLCDTNNYTKGITKIIPSNNKAGKAIGLILYILAREYLKTRGKKKEAEKLNMEDFTGKIEEIEGEGAKEGV